MSEGEIKDWVLKTNEFFGINEQKKIFIDRAFTVSFESGTAKMEYFSIWLASRISMREDKRKA